MDIADVFFDGGAAFFFFVQLLCILRKQLGGDRNLIHIVLSFCVPTRTQTYYTVLSAKCMTSFGGLLQKTLSYSQLSAEHFSGCLVFLRIFVYHVPY